MTLRLSRSLTELIVVLLLCSACAASTSSARPSLAAPVACAPNDPSWGCQNGPVTTPNVAPSTPNVAPSTPNVAPSTPNVAPSTPNVAPSTPQGSDPLNLTDAQYLRGEAQRITAELVAALDSQLRPRVAALPLVFDPSRTEVNAYATCSRTGKAAIAITDGMLVLNAHLAELKAVDELYSTRLFADYIAYVAANQKAGEAIVAPPSNWLSTEQRNNPRKLARHHHLFDEMLAFVFAHELAHHYLNHLPCTSILPLNAADLGLLLTDAIPAFNQPNEGAADVAGIRNVLMAGKQRTASPLTEVGAMTQLEFFGSLDNARPADVFSFERTHPPPSLRVPVVQSAAQAFRLSSGVTWPFGT